MGYANIVWNVLVLWSALFWSIALIRSVNRAAHPWESWRIFMRRLWEEEYLATSVGFFLVAIAHMMFSLTRITQYWISGVNVGAPVGVWVGIATATMTLVAGEWLLCRVQLAGSPLLWKIYNRGMFFFSGGLLGILAGLEWVYA